MLKLGIIGLGDIAQKAYLPVYSSMEGIEFHLFTPNQEKCAAIGEKYRFEHLHPDLSSLIASGIKGAFVHSSTVTHEKIVEELLMNNIHVFVDKPITDHYESSKRLVGLAESRNLILMAGFNRRYAPAYNRLKQVENPNMVIVQKNRKALPGEIRTFIFDDFIHVVDTVRYLFPYPIDNLNVTGVKKGNNLSQVVVQFISAQGTALAIMNRENGTNEEKAEVMGPFEKRTAYNLAKVVLSKDQEETEIRTNDWESTLHKRGFEQMTSDFIQAIKQNSTPDISAGDALETHRICEEIVKRLEQL